MILSPERDRGHARESNRPGWWKREGDSARALAKERERKEQIRSQDLKLAGVRWLYWRPEFLAGAVRLLLKY